MSKTIIRRRDAISWLGLGIYLAYAASVQHDAAAAILGGIGFILVIAAGLLTLVYGQ